MGKKPIGIKVEGKDPYTEVADIINDWCMMNYYGSAFVTLSLDGRVTTEYLSFNGNDMEFEWDMDWWEGERNVVLLGFRMRSDVEFYGYPKERKKQTNADRIRQKSDEELAHLFVQISLWRKPATYDTVSGFRLDDGVVKEKEWLDWLRKEVEESEN